MYSLKNAVPCGHRVIVKLVRPKGEKEVKTDWGFVTELKDNKTIDAEKYAMQDAHVVAIGKTAFSVFGDGLPWCKLGDLVLIAQYSGKDRADEETGDVYRLINDEDIFAVLTEEDK